jgi:hypothetical protein
MATKLWLPWWFCLLSLSLCGRGLPHLLHHRLGSGDQNECAVLPLLLLCCPPPPPVLSVPLPLRCHSAELVEKVFFFQTPLALALVHRSSCVQRARTTAECCSARTRSLVSHFFFRSLGHHALSRYTALALKGCRSSEINANERLSHRPVKCMRPSV